MVRNFSVVKPSNERWNPTTLVISLEILITIFIVIGNITLPLFLSKSRFKHLKSNIFIFSLTLSDFLIGSVQAPLIHYISFSDTSQLYYDVYINTGQCFSRISSMTIMVISIDRYLKLSYPIEHKARWDGRETKIRVAISVWLFSIILSIIKFIYSIYFGGNYIKGCIHREYVTILEKVDVLITIMGCNIVATVLYVKVIQIAKKSLRRGLQTYLNSDLCSETVNSLGLRRHQGCYEKNRVVAKHYPWKPYIVLGLIIVLNHIFVAAPPLIFTIGIMCRTCVGDNLIQALPTIFLMSSAINPIIFPRFDTKFCKFLLSIFKF